MMISISLVVHQVQYYHNIVLNTYSIK